MKMTKSSLLIILSTLLVFSLACSLTNQLLNPTPVARPPANQPQQAQPQPQQAQSQPQQAQSQPPQQSQPSASSGYDVPDVPDAFSSSSGDLAFYDDFSSPYSGWDRDSSENIYTDYVGDSYHIAVYRSGQTAWANPGLYFSGDVQVAVEATTISGDADNDFGILCRYSGNPSTPNYYFFEISSDGYAVIGKVVNGMPELLSSDNMVFSNAIIQEVYATNYLEADCIGNQLTFYVNGTQVAYATDSSLVDGDVGLDAGTFSAAYTEIAFDNFTVKIP